MNNNTPKNSTHRLFSKLLVRDRLTGSIPRVGRRGILAMRAEDDDWFANIDGHVQVLKTGDDIAYVRTNMVIDGPRWSFVVLERDDSTTVPEYLIEAVEVRRLDGGGAVVSNVPQTRVAPSELTIGIVMGLVAGTVLLSLAWLGLAWGWL